MNQSSVPQDCPDTLKHASDGNVIGLRKAVQSGVDVNETLKVDFSLLFFLTHMKNESLCNDEC